MAVGWQAPELELDELELLLEEDEVPGSGAAGQPSAEVVPPHSGLPVLHSIVQTCFRVSSNRPWPGAVATKLIWLPGAVDLVSVRVPQPVKPPVGARGGISRRRPFSYISICGEVLEAVA